MIRAFSFNLGSVGYFQLWTQLQGITGFFPANVQVPDTCTQITIAASVAAINISDSNNANVGGMPMGIGTKVTFQSTGRSIGLKEIYISGNGAGVSGIIVY